MIQYKHNRDLEVLWPRKSLSEAQGGTGGLYTCVCAVAKQKSDPNAELKDAIIYYKRSRLTKATLFECSTLNTMKLLTLFVNTEPWSYNQQLLEKFWEHFLS